MLRIESCTVAVARSGSSGSYKNNISLYIYLFIGEARGYEMADSSAIGATSTAASVMILLQRELLVSFCSVLFFAVCRVRVFAAGLSRESQISFPFRKQLRAQLCRFIFASVCHTQCMLAFFRQLDERRSK